MLLKTAINKFISKMFAINKYIAIVIGVTQLPNQKKNQ